MIVPLYIKKNFFKFLFKQIVFYSHSQICYNMFYKNIYFLNNRLILAVLTSRIHEISQKISKRKNSFEKM